MSHIGAGDLYGDVVFQDGTRVRWMIRHAGIAALLYPDNGVVFLLDCQYARDRCCEGPQTK
jgi:hypothetical protein